MNRLTQILVLPFALAGILGCHSTHRWETPRVLSIDELGEEIEGPVQLHMHKQAWDYAIRDLKIDDEPSDARSGVTAMDLPDGGVLVTSLCEKGCVPGFVKRDDGSFGLSCKCRATPLSHGKGHCELKINRFRFETLTIEKDVTDPVTMQVTTQSYLVPGRRILPPDGPVFQCVGDCTKCRLKLNAVFGLVNGKVEIVGRKIVCKCFDLMGSGNGGPMGGAGGN